MPRARLLLLLTVAALSGCAKPTPSGSVNKPAESIANGSTATPAATAPAQPAADSADLIRINGRGFTQADLDFAALMLRLNILSQGGAAADEAAALKRVDNVNIQLDHVIERYAMGLLGEEKHYAIPDDEVNQARRKLQDQLANNPKMQALVQTYGEDRFQGRLPEYLRQELIRRRIIAELLDEQKTKTPAATPAELDYHTAQAYDALYQDHVGDLDIQISLKGLPPKAGAEKPEPTRQKPAPALKAYDAAGGPFAAAVPTAKPLLLNFWATWCAPCREELPLLLQAQASGKYDVLAVNVDESPEKVQSFLKAQHLEGLTVAYAKTKELKGWVIPGLPTTYLIGEGWSQRGQMFGPLTREHEWMQGL